MRLVITSDCHGMLDRVQLPAGDMLIIAGDVFRNHSGKADIDASFQLNDLASFDEYCAELPFKKILLIAGNHDWVFQIYKPAHTSLKHIIYLEDSGVEIAGIKFYGSPHQPWFFDWAFNEPRGGAALRHYWSLIPDDTDVLITHGPPLGILDQPFGRGEHAGCELLLKRVEEVNPRVHCFGHIHGSYGKRQIGGTLFLNASLCNEAYQPVNAPHVVDL
ncbi:MAG: metallophosphatase domain-containing protein [Acidobacteriota bacterium]